MQEYIPNERIGQLPITPPTHTYKELKKQKQAIYQIKVQSNGCKDAQQTHEKNG